MWKIRSESVEVRDRNPIKKFDKSLAKPDGKYYFSRTFVPRPKKQTPSSPVITNRTILFFVFLLFAFVAGFVNGCHCGGGSTAASPCDTTTKTDTVYLPQPKDSTPTRVPTLAETKPSPLSPHKPTLPPLRDTQALSLRWVSAESYAYLLSLYRAVERERDSLWEKYYAANYYRDTATLSGGTLTFSGVSQENRIQGVQYAYVPPPIPVVTKVVTVQQPSRNQVWAGLQAGYQLWDSTATVGASLDFLHKRGWGAGGYGKIDVRGRTEVGVKTSYLIKAKR